MTNTNVIGSTELRAELAHVLKGVADGAAYTITHRGRPIATIGPYAAEAARDAETVARESTAEYDTTRHAPPSPGPPTALMRLVGGSDAMRSVLGLFIREPDRSFYQREVARSTGLALRSTQLALEKLLGLGLIASERSGNRRYYRAVRSERFNAVQSLLGAEIGIAEVIARHLRRTNLDITRAFVFGSTASGSDTVDSDIDLLVIGEVRIDDLAGPIAAAERELGREIEFVSYRPDQFAERQRAGNHFIHTVMAQPRVDVIGSDDGA